MHPLIGAHIKLRELADLVIRPWSPYFPEWARMLEEQKEFIRDLTETHPLHLYTTRRGVLEIVTETANGR